MTGKKFAELAKYEALKRYNYNYKDCQGFVELVYNKLLDKNINYRGSNDMLRNFIVELHEINDWNNIPNGALLFMIRKKDYSRLPARYHIGGSGYVAKYDGWNASHVGIYIGDMESAESAKSIGFTSITKNRPWTHWAKAKGIEYDDFSSMQELHKNYETEIPPKEMYAIAFAKNGKKINIREKPSTSSKVTAKIESNSIIKTVKLLDSSWCKVMNSSRIKVGYIMSKYIIYDEENLLSSLIEKIEDVKKDIVERNLKM